MIKHSDIHLNHQKGFTMIETMVVLAIIVIVTAIAIPTYVTLLPNYRLKSAAQDLYSNLQSAKMQAIKKNNTSTVKFDISGGEYTKSDDTKVILNKVYKGSVSYGKPTSAPDETYAGTPPQVEFNARGMTNNTDDGWVYLTNNKGRYYEVGTFPSGVIMLKKWNGSDWE